MSEYPQEVIDTLRNLVACQDRVIADARAVIAADQELIDILKAQVKMLKGE